MCIYWRCISIILVCGAIGLPGPAFAEDTVIPAASNAIPANRWPAPDLSRCVTACKWISCEFLARAVLTV